MGVRVFHVLAFVNNATMSICYCCSVAHSCLTLCDPVDCSMPGFLVLHSLLELCPLSQWCHPTSSSSVASLSSCFQPFPASVSFPMSWLFLLGGQSIGASASATVFPMNIQSWFPLGLTGLISLLSKGLSRVFSSSIIRKHLFFSTQPSLWPELYGYRIEPFNTRSKQSNQRCGQ